MKAQPLKSNEIEAANRAEATALLIRCRYRVYRPEADVSGEDLVIRKTDGTLVPVQLKSRLTVNRPKYGKDGTWMLFPDSNDQKFGRSWFLISHNELFDYLKQEHPKLIDAWHNGKISKAEREFLKSAELLPRESNRA